MSAGDLCCMLRNSDSTEAPSAGEDYVEIVRDLRQSLTLGPVSVVLSIASYAVLYPLIVERYGYSTIGLWGLLTAVSTALLAADIGFSLQVQRDTSLSMSADEHEAMRADISASRGLYTAVWLLAMAAAVLAYPVIQERAGAVYAANALFYSIVAVSTSAWLLLLAALDRAVLIGLRDASFTYVAAISTPVITFVVALYGVLGGRPIEGFSTALLLGSVVLLGAFRLRLRRRHHSWAEDLLPRGSFLDLKRAARFAYRGSGFYAGTIGLVIREPVIRFITAGVAGLVGVAALDIAFRATNAARGLATTGAAPMLSAFALFSRERNSEGSLRFTRDSLATILIRGGLPVATVIAFSPLIPIWLGQPNAEVVAATRIIALWGFITLFNVPFWYCLLANHDEKFAAGTVWIQGISLLGLFPLSQLVDLSAVSVAAYWLGSSLLTQSAIYARVGRRFVSLSATFGFRRVRVAVALAVASVVVALVISMGLDPSRIGTALPMVVAWAGWSLVYLGFLLLVRSRRWDSSKNVGLP